MRDGNKIINNIDWPLFSVYMILMILGLTTVYSVAYNPEAPNLFDFSQKYGKQVVWLLVSLFLGLLVLLIDANIYTKFATPIYLFTLVLLVIVLFMPAKFGARAWLGIGSLGIQPAEFAKIGTALLLAKYISSVNIKLQNIQTVLIANVIILIPMVLILLQPDAGTFVVYTSFLFVMYREGITYDPLVLKLVNLIPGIKFKQTWVGSHFIPIMFAAVFLVVATLLVSNNIITFDFLPGVEIPGVVGIITTLFTFAFLSLFLLRYVGSRRDKKSALTIVIIGLVLTCTISLSVSFLFQGMAPHQDQDGDDYNRNRAMAAGGSGGFFGKGYNKASVSSVETNHVPESETDFIFCPFAEEWGFFGSLILVGLYMFMLF